MVEYDGFIFPDLDDLTDEAKQGIRRQVIEAVLKRQEEIKRGEKHMDKKFIITVLGGGQGYTLTDSDMWGLRDCLYHCIGDGYLKENQGWGETMVERINKLRHSGEEDE